MSPNAHSPNHWYGEIDLERMPAPGVFDERQRLVLNGLQIHLA